MKERKYLFRALGILIFGSCLLSCVTTHKIPALLLGEDLDIAYGTSIKPDTLAKFTPMFEGESGFYLEYPLKHSKYFKSLETAMLFSGEEPIYIDLRYSPKDSYDEKLLNELVSELIALYGSEYKKTRGRENSYIPRNIMTWSIKGKIEIEFFYYEPETIKRFPKYFDKSNFYWLMYSRPLRN